MPTGGHLAAQLGALAGIDVEEVSGRCTVKAPTIRTLETLAELGIVVDAFEFPETLASLQDPLVEAAEEGTVRVFLRLAERADVAYELGDDATFDTELGAFVAPASAVADWPEHLLPEALIDPVTDQHTKCHGGAQTALDVATTGQIEDPQTVADAVHNLAGAPGTDGYEREIELLTAAYGDVPDWFGMTPYPYQRIGALCVAAGRRLLADVPGLGKSVQAILASVLLDAKRWIIVTPPVAQTNWASEIQRCHVPEHLDDAPIVLIRPGRKVPDLPATGIVIVTDSLLAAPTRRPLLENLKAWGADVLIYDEGHRAKNWHSGRAKVMRELATTATDRMVLTGTPVMSNPADLPSLLAITGQLQPVFGSRTAFMNRYTRTYEIPVGCQTIEKIVPNKKLLPELGRILPEQVWVRRTKDQVLPDLPEKQYSTMIVDVPTTEYRTATRDVQAKITAYLRERSRELGEAPSEAEVRAWCSDQMGCVSLLRRAAGLAKIPAAAEYIADWVDSTTHHDGETTVFERPLIVWGIHQTVMNGLDAHLDQLGVPHAVINGSTSLTQRDRITRDYQDGKIAVILANIVAAGVAITLTRGSDALFVETEWLPDLVSQAVDRQHRIGQKRTVTITTMVAPGTLDHTIQKVQRTNIDVLDQLVGGTGHHVAVEEDDMSSLAIGDVMWELAEPLWLNMRSEAPREAMR
ncbi:DEAD/DEAH box helicase [Brachybacterium atlanticum]|uniref:DEAD/DEAH box helicase n=1 Tax=Brachybacterium atlanticum TaxID=2911888 RepID=UPI0021E0ED20|nr:DEAD/DEAH box helicase [Brachybacterium atlanticum]